MDGRRLYCVVNHTAYNSSHSLEDRSASVTINVRGKYDPLSQQTYRSYSPACAKQRGRRYDIGGGIKVRQGRSSYGSLPC